MLVPCDIFHPVHGAGTAAYFTVKYLARRNLLRVLLTHAYSIADKMDIVHPNLSVRYCRKSALDNFGFKGVVLNPFFLKSAHNFMNDYEIDLIQCELLWSILCGSFLKKKFGKPLVLVNRNVEFLNFWEMGRIFFSNFVHTLEKFGCQQADKIVVVSETDKVNLMKLYDVTEEKICVIPNCVDPDVFKFSEERRGYVRKKYKLAPEKIVLTFVGKLDYIPNVRGVKYISRKIYPAIMKKYPESVFFIIGKCYKPLMKYGRKNLIFTGYVNDLSSYLSASDIFLVPLDAGSGTRLKILEAASVSRPIVSTRKGAEGLDFVDKKEILLNEGVNEDFIEKIIKLIEDKRLRKIVGNNARKKIEKQYSWSKEIKKFNELYNKI